MRVTIIGSTGFIGREVASVLHNAGHRVKALSRNVEKARQILGNEIETAEWDGITAGTLADLISGSDAVINLAGENIASGRWTRRRKKLIRESRVLTGHLVAEAIRMAAEKPSVVIQGSATGYYGTPVGKAAGENAPAGSGFLAELTKDWEASVDSMKTDVRRVIYIRTGIVLGTSGGMLKKMLFPFRFSSGAVLGPGSQWISWIHMRDAANAIRFLMENGQSSGPYNLVAPEAATMTSFIAELAIIINKPAWIRIPGFLLKAALGEMAEQTILASQNIRPEKLLEEGFIFDYRELHAALQNLLLQK